jgi:hypothetical protein
MGHVFLKKRPKRYLKVRRKTAQANSSSTITAKRTIRMLDTFKVNGAKELQNLDLVELKKFKRALQRGVPYGAKRDKNK